MKKIVSLLILICLLLIIFSSCKVKPNTSNNNLKTNSSIISSVAEKRSSSKISSLTSSSSKSSSITNPNNNSSSNSKSTFSTSNISSSSSTNVPKDKGKIVNYSFGIDCNGLLLYENGDVYLVKTIRPLANATCKFDTYKIIFTDARYIYADESRYIVITNNNDLYAWGTYMPNENASFGSSSIFIETPRLIMSDVKSAEHRYIITNNGDLYIYGEFRTKDYKNNEYNVYKPKKILSNMKAIKGDTSEAFGLTKNGDLLKWDNNNVRAYIANDKIPLAYNILYSSVKSFNSWQSEYCFITNSDDLFFCGTNHQNVYTTPTKIASNVKFVCFNNNALAYLTNIDELYCFGNTTLKISDNIKYIYTDYFYYYIDKNNNLYSISIKANNELSTPYFIRNNCLISTRRSDMSFELTTLGDLYIFINEYILTSKVIF